MIILATSAEFSSKRQSAPWPTGTELTRDVCKATSSAWCAAIMALVSLSACKYNIHNVKLKDTQLIISFKWEATLILYSSTYRSSLWTLLHIILLAPKILRTDTCPVLSFWQCIFIQIGPYKLLSLHEALLNNIAMLVPGQKSDWSQSLWFIHFKQLT